ncbi:MAG TPA: hypothetical protein VMF88_03635 [Bacteroidota bacterium]|nr:hypothetical protein [Bacteroidota bacterium]
MAKKTHKGGEYRMLIQPTFDETLKKEGTLFLIETVKQFSSFSYEVVVEETREEKRLTWALHGLRAPELLMPSFGGAQFKKVYFDLKGTVTFILKKIDGEANEFKVKLSPSSAAVQSVSGKPFVTVYTSQKLFEEQRPKEMEMPKRKPDIKRLPERLPLRKKP